MNLTSSLLAASILVFGASVSSQGTYTTYVSLSTETKGELGAAPRVPTTRIR